MSAPMLEAVLAEHERKPYDVCSCGWLPAKVHRVGDGQHRAHVAAVIREWATNDEAVDRVWSVLDEHGHNGIDCRPRAGFDLSIKAALTVAFGGEAS